MMENLSAIVFCQLQWLLLAPLFLPSQRRGARPVRVLHVDFLVIVVAPHLVVLVQVGFNVDSRAARVALVIHYHLAIIARVLAHQLTDHPEGARFLILLMMMRRTFAAAANYCRRRRARHADGVERAIFAAHTADRRGRAAHIRQASNGALLLLLLLRLRRWRRRAL